MPLFPMRLVAPDPLLNFRFGMVSKNAKLKAFFYFRFT
jgi:hypothetical protein